MAMTPLPDEDHRRAAASSFENAHFEMLSFNEAKSVVIDYEYLHNMGTTKHAVGLFFGWYLAGVACFGSTAGSAVTMSLCGKEHAHRVITLVRGTCVHWAHPHSASFMINGACELISKKFGYNIFIAYSDPDADEIGTVYQASNWDYIGEGGSVSVNERKISTMTRDRRGRPTPRRGATQADVDAWVERRRAEGAVIKGVGLYKYVEKMTRAEAKAKMLAAGVDFTKGSRKHRYVHFAGDKRTVRLLKKAFKPKVLAYPKRDAGKLQGALLAPPTEAQFEAAAPLQNIT